MPFPMYRCGVSLFVAALTAPAMCLTLSAPALAAIVINEIDSQPTDFVELYNTGGVAVDVGNYSIDDNNPGNPTVIPGGTMIQPGGFLLINNPPGLGNPDEVNLFDGGAVLIDSFGWNDHAATTLGRCPDGTGAIVTTAAATPGAANSCFPAAAAWPGGASVTIVDQANALGTDVSGLDYEGTGTTTKGVLWATQNDPGKLYRLVWNGSQWVHDTANGWSTGKQLDFAAGLGGAPDAEGVTLTDAGAAGGVFVASERDGGGGSAPSVLRYDVSGAGAPLVAIRQWNLTDLTGLPANGGPEAVEWIPDTYLVGAGFLDQAQGGQPYDPADYPGHGAGLFFVGIETGGTVYAYALNDNQTFTQISSFASGSPSLAAMHWDGDEKQLWVLCDDTCDGRSRVFEVNGGGNFAQVATYARPAGMANLNNEGFTFTPDGECVGGIKPVYWVDDENTGGNALRAGTINCTPAPPSFDNLIGGDIDANPRDDLVYDPGTTGIFALFNGTTWTKLHPTLSQGLALGDVNGNARDDLAVDFGVGGLWVRSDAGAWTKIHLTSPEEIITARLDNNATEEVVADLGATGLWARYNNTTWTQLHPALPEGLASGDLDGNGVEDLLIDFGVGGLYARYNNATWTKLHTTSPDDALTARLDNNARREAIVDFGVGGLWARFNNTTWTKLHIGNAIDLAAGDLNGNGLDDLLVNFGATGLWARYDNGTWVQLHPTTPRAIAVADIDNSGRAEAVADFGPNNLWARFNNTTWVKLPTLPP